MFDTYGCKLSAFTIFFIGTTSVYLFVAISIERYINELYKKIFNRI